MCTNKRFVAGVVPPFPTESNVTGQTTGPPKEYNPLNQASPTSIREATADDTPLIFEFLEPFVQQHLLLQRSEDEIRELTKHAFIAFADEACIGFSAIEIYSRKLAEIQCLAVAAEYRNQGIGRELVSRCAMRAKELGVMEVMAISSSDRFLQSCGFEFALPDQKKALFYRLRDRY